MRDSRSAQSYPACVAILKIAAWLVPGGQREEWLAEWRAELWHVWQAYRHSAQPSLRDHRQASAFCLGAFHDALWLRRHAARTPSRSVWVHGSPLRCELVLAVLALATLATALCLPGARKALMPSPYREADNLVTIAAGGSTGQPPTVRLGDYRDWSPKAKRLFTEFAYYQPLVKRVHFGRHAEAPELSIARASDNIFTLLNIPTAFPDKAITADRGAARLVLSRELWQSSFHSDPRIFGSFVDIAGTKAVIAGVVAGDDWRLPGRFDLWLLETEDQLAALPAHIKGYALGRVVPEAFSVDVHGRRQLLVARHGREYDAFDCVSLAEQTGQPLTTFLFTLLLACLALPATTSLPLGEYPARRGPLPWATQLRRWLFLMTKIGWIVAIVYCGSLDAAFCVPSMSFAGSEWIQLGTAFLALLFAFRWALRDQRQRCPICLRALTNPARVGESSRNFLAWNGTELICVDGHGLLHVPDLPTSWFGTQRWLYLDSSWSGLFAGGHLASAGLP